MAEGGPGGAVAQTDGGVLGADGGIVLGDDVTADPVFLRVRGVGLGRGQDHAVVGANDPHGPVPQHHLAVVDGEDVEDVVGGGAV